MSGAAPVLAAALVASTVGMACLALAMPDHWRQVRDDAIGRGGSLALRGLGGFGLVVSFTACFTADHASMAALVWVMSLALGAVVTAVALALRPSWLRPLVAWMPRR